MAKLHIYLHLANILIKKSRPNSRTLSITSKGSPYFDYRILAEVFSAYNERVLPLSAKMRNFAA